MKLPERTSEIFERLSKGDFICSNSTNKEICFLYDIIHENEAELISYFAIINFVLERGNEYFYFSKKDNKTEISKKIERAEAWIDFIDFLKTFDTAFTNGYRFFPSDIEVRTRLDVNLRDKLEGLKRHLGDVQKTNELVMKMIQSLVKDGFVELENEITRQYKVVAAFHYVEQLILSINIPEELQHEISE